MFFNKKPLNNVDPSVCNPIIVNQTNHSIVLFLDRGVLYNKQVLAPGEAVAMTRKENAGTVVPYRVHAVVGDEQSLPTQTQSLKNALSTLVIPTAFIAGTLMAASTAGTSKAVTRVAGGIAVRGMVIDSAALAAGSLRASQAAVIASRLVEEYPENYSAKSGFYLPGNRYVVVRGGIEEPLTIESIKQSKFRRLEIQGELKTPMDTLKEQLDYYTPSFLSRSSKTEDESSSSSEEESREQVEAKPQQATVTGRDPAQARTSTIADEMLEQEMLRATKESLQMEEERKRQGEHIQRRLKETIDTTHEAVLF